MSAEAILPKQRPTTPDRQQLGITYQVALVRPRTPLAERVLADFANFRQREAELYANPPTGAEQRTRIDFEHQLVPLYHLQQHLLAGGEIVVAIAQENGETVGIYASTVHTEQTDDESPLVNNGFTYMTVRTDRRRQGIGERLTMLGRRQFFDMGIRIIETSLNNMSRAMVEKAGFSISEDGITSLGNVLITVTEQTLRREFERLGLDFEDSSEYEMAA